MGYCTIEYEHYWEYDRIRDYWEYDIIRASFDGILRERSGEEESVCVRESESERRKGSVCEKEREWEIWRERVRRCACAHASGREISCACCRITPASRNTEHHTAPHRDTLQHTATHCDTLHYTTPHCSAFVRLLARAAASCWPPTTEKYFSVTHCPTLPHTAMHYNTLQHTTPHYTTLHHAEITRATYRITLASSTTEHHTATHCNTLQHTTTHCNTLRHTTLHYTTLQCVCEITCATCRITLASRTTVAASASSCSSPPSSVTMRVYGVPFDECPCVSVAHGHNRRPTTHSCTHASVVARAWQCVDR